MIDILWQDEDYVAVNKPSGLGVHRGRNRWDQGQQFLLQVLRDQLERPVWPVHRLDRGSSGVMLFALAQAAVEPAARIFREKLARKSYLALVRGWMADSGSETRPLKRMDGEGLQEARTRFRSITRLELPYPVGPFPSCRLSLLSLAPTTGRRHQLRRHLAGMAHPILGDSDHGDGRQNRAFASWFGQRRLMLHALRLALPHPLGHEWLVLRAPIPEGWERLGRIAGDQPR